MPLLAQDVVVILKLIANNATNANPTYATLGEELFMSPSQVFRSVKRAEAAKLLTTPAVSHPKAPLPRRWLMPYSGGNLKEYLIHAVKYDFPVERGGATRGIPTAEAADPLKQNFPQDFALPPVWPFAEGKVRGLGFSPLHENAPRAALRDGKLYELLALLDAIREGRAREREIAIRELSARIDAR